MPGGFKVTDYSRIQKWIRNANAGAVSDKRLDSESEQCISEDQPVVRRESHHDSISERASAPRGQHADHGEVHGPDTLHGSPDPASNRIERPPPDTARSPPKRRSPDPIADHVEDVRSKIEALSLYRSHKHANIATHDTKLSQDLTNHAGSSQKPCPFDMTDDEIVLSVIEAHDRAEARLKDLEKSRDTTQALHQSLRKKMLEAERTGQLQGNLREEWRLYGEIVKQVDDLFLRRSDGMQHREEERGRKRGRSGGGERRRGEGVGEGGDSKEADRNDQVYSASEYSVESRV